MLKFKSTMRRSKATGDALVSCPDLQAAPSLQRSNAKFRKRDSSAGDDQRRQLSASAKSPIGDDMFHFGLDARENSWELNKPDHFPPGAHCTAPRTGHENLRAFSKIFSRAKTKQKTHSPADNFTKWDVPGCYGLSSQLSNPDANSIVAASSLSPAEASRPWSRNSDVPGRRVPHPVYLKEEYSVTSTESLDDVHASDSMYDDGVFDSIPSRPKGKGRMSGIADIDWNDYTDQEALRMLLASFEDQQQRDFVSPADSAIAMTEQDPANDQGVHGSDMWIMDEQKLQQEIEATTQMWSDRLHALQVQKEQELERQRQEEEDRRQAEILAEIAEQQRIELERQEAEDLRRALEIQEEEARKAAELARRQDCIICGDSYHPSELPLASPQCEHDPQTCSNCMQQWLESELTSKGCSELRCPQCPRELEYADIQRLTSEKTFVSYEKLLTRNALASLDEFAWCLKGDECNSGQLNEDNNNFMDCQNCGYKQCLKCKVAWHTGETCEQYEYRSSGKKQKDEEEATQKMLDDISKKCPGTNCGWRIQKTDGCDHMTCKKCKFEFCWECLASHKEIKRIGNTAHDKNCKFHSDNLDVAWPFNVH